MSILEKYTERIDRAGSLFGQDLIFSWDATEKDIDAVLAAAAALKKLAGANISCRMFDGGAATAILRDAPLDMRMAYVKACSLLGLTSHEIDMRGTHAPYGERVTLDAYDLGQTTEAVAIFDSVSMGKSSEYINSFSSALSDARMEGIIKGKPAVIAARSELDEPVFALGCAMALENRFGSTKALEGKKAAIVWTPSTAPFAPVATPQSLMAMMTRFGMETVLAHPKGFDVMKDTHMVAQMNAIMSGGSFTVTDEVKEAYWNADVVFPVNWTPASILMEKVYREARGKDISDLKESYAEKTADLGTWRCTDEMVKLTRDSVGMLMPVMSESEGGMDKSVADRYRITAYESKDSYAYIFAAAILLAKAEDPSALLQEFENRRTPLAMR